MSAVASISTSTPERDMKIHGQGVATQPQSGPSFDFFGRSSSIIEHARTSTSASFEPARASSELEEEATVDSILADYRSREAERRKSNASSIEKINVPSQAWKTAHGVPHRALLNRIGGIFGDMIDRKGWRKS